MYSHDPNLPQPWHSYGHGTETHQNLSDTSQTLHLDLHLQTPRVACQEGSLESGVESFASFSPGWERSPAVAVEGPVVEMSVVVVDLQRCSTTKTQRMSRLEP